MVGGCERKEEQEESVLNLSRVQRRSAIRVAVAYNTSGDAIVAVTGIPPVDLLARERKAVHDGLAPKLAREAVPHEKKAGEATKNICAICGDILDVRKYQRWFRKLKSGKIDIKDEPGRQRQNRVATAALKTQNEMTAVMTISKLLKKISASWSNTQISLKQIGKVQDRVFGFRALFLTLTK